MLPLLLGDLLNGPAFQGLFFARCTSSINVSSHLNIRNLTLFAIRRLVPGTCVGAWSISRCQGWAPRRVGQFRFAFGERANRGFVPRRQLVKQPDGFQR